MWQYNHTPDPDELMHYGVRGMKWKKGRKSVVGPAAAVSLTRSKTFGDRNMRWRQKRAKKRFKNQMSDVTKKYISQDLKVYRKGKQAILDSKTQKQVDNAVKKTKQGYAKAGKKYQKKARKVTNAYQSVLRGHKKELADKIKRHKKK